jgi:hypothetical protein
MKHTAGYAKPRRLATPRRPVQLHLRQRQAPKPEDERETGQRSAFWRWVALVTLFHLVAISLLYWFYEAVTPPPPPVQFISLLPTGDVVKGEPGIQKAHKVGPTTPAPSVHHIAPPPEAAAPKPPVPQVIKPPPTPPEPVVKEDAPPIMPDKPVTPKPVAGQTEGESRSHAGRRSAPTTDKPVAKPKPPPEKDGGESSGRLERAGERERLDTRQRGAEQGGNRREAGREAESRRHRERDANRAQAGRKIPRRIPSPIFTPRSATRS